jgi:hypothetical protein
VCARACFESDRGRSGRQGERANRPRTHGPGRGAQAGTRAAVAAAAAPHSGRRALRALNLITRAAQSSLDDVRVRADTVRRGWDGL